MCFLLVVTRGRELSGNKKTASLVCAEVINGGHIKCHETCFMDAYMHVHT